MSNNYYIAVDVQANNRDDELAPEAKELADLHLEVFETFPFLLGKIRWGRIVVLVEM